MEAAERETLQAAADWLDEGRRVWLVTVAATWGSSPRPPGSLLALCDDGRYRGAVSGGCLETELSDWVRAQRPEGPQVLTFGTEAGRGRGGELSCGGRLELVVEPLSSPAPLRAILGALDGRRRVRRRLCLETGEASLHGGEGGPAFAYDGRNLDQVFGPQWRLLIIGAGELSRLLAELALGLDFEVIVCDPREHSAGSWDLPQAPLRREMPDDLVRAWADDARAAVVALTHEPNLDDLALMEALDARAFYVGALGSRVNSARRRDRLAGLGVSEAGLRRLRGPVGLPLGGRRPAEIALAIAAELVATRNGVRLQRSTEPHPASPAEA